MTIFYIGDVRKIFINREKPVPRHEPYSVQNNRTERQYKSF